LSAELKLPLWRNAGSASRARGAATLFLTALGIAAKVVADAALIITELVANAVRHGKDPIEMGLAVNEDTLRIEVSDGGELSEPIVATSVSPDQAAGRGLAIVEACSLRWGVINHAKGGKTVWVEVRTNV
jgi:anti-sigma regulatory factor (Ser/Thr protein kinase)